MSLLSLQKDEMWLVTDQAWLVTDQAWLVTDQAWLVTNIEGEKLNFNETLDFITK